ncbi:hypothetical protein L208DRAFT_1247461 [Tricholoma matsutake]|nr:hypothetical protein L208DRAFT_1247461 [Tricholoma matsutake 945]
MSHSPRNVNERSFRAELAGPSSLEHAVERANVVKTRTSNKATRRIRGEIACAECRRLKIRCDRIIPCSTCVKRGCTALCPNGTIPPGEGSRFVLAATDHLRQKILKLEARMHSLEDAIAIVHDSSDTHPLLMSLDVDDEDVEVEEGLILKPVIEELEPSTLLDSLGALHLDRHGGARFFGPSGGSEKAKDLEGRTPSQTSRLPLQELDSSHLPAEINVCYEAFPFTRPGIVPASVQSMIETFLPSIERAIILCDIFLEHLSWMFHIVSRRQMVNELIPAVYKQTRVPYGPHDLALMLIVLGIGCLVDLSLQPYNLEAQHYYRLARASIALQPVLGQQSVVTIKVVLHLMSIYYGMSGKESNLEQSYILLDLAGQVALRVHIDPSQWGFQGKEAYERRVYFWNLMAGVLWQSLVTGRPPALLTTYIDCRIPTAEDEYLFQQGEVPLGFGIWGFRASLECMIPLVRTILAVKPPSYQAVLELDRKIRTLTQPQPDDPSEDRTAVTMRIFVRSHYQALMLLFLHRGFFAQAMSENPANPLHSSYSQSVLAAYSSACVVLDSTKAQYFKQRLLCARVWRIWSLAFSAAVIVGTIAIRGHHLNLTPPAFEVFDSACAMFKNAAETSSRAARAMPILQIMLRKALQAHSQHSNPHDTILSDSHPDDELSIFAGRTRLVSPEQPFTSPATTPRPSQSRLTHNEPLGVYSQQLGSLDHQLLPRESLPNKQVFLPDNYIDNYQATFSDLSGGWDGLFHEVPQPSYAVASSSTSHTIHPSGDGAMVDDRWASFMHNYNILTQPSQR